MTIHLPLDVENRIREKLESGRFSDEGDVVRAALSLLDESEARYREQHDRLKVLVLAGFESGGTEELTDELWDEMERASEEAFLRGDVPNPDVCP